MRGCPAGVTMSQLSQPGGRVLVTIPISHYCEKARWALDRAGLAYAEQRHVQLVHRVAARRAGGGRTVPVLVAPEGVFADSRAILFYADAACPPARRLYPSGDDVAADVRALEQRFDAILGPEGRRWMYQQAFGHVRAFAPYNLTGVPAWERRAFPLLLLGARPYIRRRLEVSEAGAAQARLRVDAELDAVARRLADGRAFLMGDRFTAADLAFAALAAAVVFPPGYGVPLPQPEELPAPVADQLDRWREHPAGAFALRMYREERAGPVQPPAGGPARASPGPPRTPAP